MMLQLSGLALLAFYFARRMTQDKNAPAHTSLAVAASILALLGTGLQIFAASQ